MEDESKQKLSNVMGALAACVARGRHFADIESLRIAIRHRQNEFLKGMSVPRLRISNVNLTLPLMITGIVPGAPATANAPGAIADAILKRMEKIFADARKDLDRMEALENKTEDQEKDLRQYRLLFDVIAEVDAMDLYRNGFLTALDGAYTNLGNAEGGAQEYSEPAIVEAVANCAERVFADLLRELSFRNIKAQVARNEDNTFEPERARKSIEDIMGRKFIEGLVGEIRLAAGRAAVLHPDDPPDLEVTVDTDAIKNAGGGPDVVSRLNIALREEGMEWVNDTTEEGGGSKLIPE